MKHLRPSVYRYFVKMPSVSSKYLYRNAQLSLMVSDHLLSFSLIRDSLFSSLEEALIHVLPTGALVLEDCQVDNENSATWEGMSYFWKWWKVISRLFPRIDVLFSCQSPGITWVTHSWSGQIHQINNFYQVCDSLYCPNLWWAPLIFQHLSTDTSIALHLPSQLSERCRWKHQCLKKPSPTVPPE